MCFVSPGVKKSKCITVYDLPCMYTNIASITAKLPSLQFYLQLKKPVCVFISETWLSSSIDDAVLGLNNYLI
jgi:hypothetical protein